jgi:hypothetical protein
MPTSVKLFPALSAACRLQKPWRQDCRYLLLATQRLSLASRQKTTGVRSAETPRFISAYGYTQAKALVYSKYGEPKDVLRWVLVLCHT